MSIPSSQCSADQGLIVAGHHRSGTSRLRRILDSHPDIRMVVEFGCYYYLNMTFTEHSRRIWRRWYHHRNNPFLKNWAVEGKPHGLHITHNLMFVSRYLANLYRLPGDWITADKVNAALCHLLRANRYIGDKYPDYWFAIDKLAREPHIQPLVIIRDPRDVTSSTLLKARGAWRNSWPDEMRDAAAVARRWVNMVEATNRNRRRIFVIYYEQFVTAPQTVLKQLAEKLALDSGGFDCSSVHKKSIGKYQDGLTKVELAQVLSVAGDHMCRLGYHLDRPGFRDVAL